MSWEAIAAIGEITGAAAVVASLLILALQMRRSTQAMEESNRFERAAALDRHADSIARWRGRITEHEDLSRLWLQLLNDDELSDVDKLRANNLWIEFVITQRSNYQRALTVGDPGLARQAILSVVAVAIKTNSFRDLWSSIRSWAQLASPEFVTEVDAERVRLDADDDGQFRNLPFVTERLRQPGGE